MRAQGVEHRGGIEHEQHDPWAFRHEWMGELDRHLFAEGNHHHIWRRMGAHVIERDGVAVLIDEMSLEFMTGSEIDFSTELIGAAFKIKNPNATAGCGCGTSFSV